MGRRRPPNSRTRALRAALVALVLACAPVLGGCSAIGFTFGAGLDLLANGHSPERLSRLGTGRAVRLRLRDGRTVQGIYLGPGTLDSAAYVRHVADWEGRPGRPDVLVPALGTPVSLEGVDGVRRGRFGGFAADGVRLAPNGAGGTATVRYHQFETLSDSSGRTERAGGLRRLTDSGRLPLVTTARLRTDRDVWTIRWTEIARVDAAAPRAGKITFGLIGLGLDAVFWIAYFASGGYSLD